MEIKLENVRIERGYDLGGLGPHNWFDVVLFALNGVNWLEYLDGDELCDEGDSNLCHHLSAEDGDAAEIRERLAAWLAGPSHEVRWVSADEQGEYTSWEVPHGGDIEAVKAACFAELLEQCGTDEDRSGILAGTIEVTRVAA